MANPDNQLAYYMDKAVKVHENTRHNIGEYKLNPIYYFTTYISMSPRIFRFSFSAAISTVWRNVLMH